jgi:CRISPR-associated endonuclease Cas1
MAVESEVSIEIVRDLLDRKVEGQLGVLQAGFTHEQAAATVQTALEGIAAAESIDPMLALEAKAATAYWGAWRGVTVRFARADERLVPEHWLAFGERQSSLSTSGRKASTPAGAILNYLYALAEFECRLALLAVGLDPGLGWAHRDAPYRDSAALDLLEPLRPEVNAFVHRLIATRTFSRREFVETRDGQVWLAAELARALGNSTLTPLGAQRLHACRAGRQGPRPIERNGRAGAWVENSWLPRQGHGHARMTQPGDPIAASNAGRGMPNMRSRSRGCGPRLLPRLHPWLQG